MNDTLRAVIIEDEPNSYELLQTAVRKYIKDVQIIGIATSVLEGVSLVKNKRPDLIFLDIELPDGSGFEILDACKDIDFKIIFVTAYNHYAIKAIKYAAMDYLLKPLNIDELEVAVLKIQKNFNSSIKPNIHYLKEKIDQNKFTEVDQIIIPTHNGYHIIQIEDIVAVEAMSNYVFFILDDNRKHLATNSLSYYEELLPPNKFYRIHRSHLINYMKIAGITSGRLGEVTMTNGAVFNLAARRKSSFLAFMKKNSNTN